jgi:hypothetical protein
MSLEDFKIRKTLESRTPYVLLLLGVVAALGAIWRAFAGLSYSVAIATGVCIVAVAYAILRYVNHRNRSD